jgi:hypothetical protein
MSPNACASRNPWRRLRAGSGGGVVVVVAGVGAAVSALASAGPPAQMIAPATPMSLASPARRHPKAKFHNNRDRGIGIMSSAGSTWQLPDSGGVQDRPENRTDGRTDGRR